MESTLAAAAPAIPRSNRYRKIQSRITSVPITIPIMIMISFPFPSSCR